METLHTPRLLLTPLAITDAPAIQAVFPQWDVVRWLDDAVPWPYPPDGAETFLRDVVVPAMAAGTAWHWRISPIDRQQLIGVISLREGERDNRGFWLAPPWQGRGLMTEASDAVTHYWFDVLGKAVLRVPKAIDNLPSRRISLKRGMRVVDSFRKTLVSGPQNMELWEITRDEWRAQFAHGSQPVQSG